MVKNPSAMQETTCSAGDRRLRFYPRVGDPLQYSSLEYSKDRGDWRATVSGVATVRRDLATKSPQPTRWHNLQAVGSVHPSFSAMKATNE